MIVDYIEREEMENVRLAQINPDAYDAKMCAIKEGVCRTEFISMLKSILIIFRKTKK